MQLQIDALNWEKEYVKNRLAGVRAAIARPNPTANRADERMLGGRGLRRACSTRS